MPHTIKIAKDFSSSPGPRFSWQGRNSGEEFRDNVLIPALKNLKKGEKLIIDLDDTDGYLFPFVDESFGKLFDMNMPYKNIVLISKQTPRYAEMIKDIFKEYKQAS